MPEVRLLIVTTVPITLRAILREQPRYLSIHFTVELATTMAGDVSDIEAVESVPGNPVSMARRISPLRDLRFIWEMAKDIRRFRPHIVHSYTPKAGLVAMAASWLCRVSGHIHPFTGLIFPSQSGVKREVLRLADTGRYARRSVDVNIELAHNLRAQGLSPPDLESCRTLEEALAATTGVRYYTDEMGSLMALSSGSVDFVCSHVVLEHVRKAQFLAMQRECARVLRSAGFCSHRIDLRDHLGGGLNDLHFRDGVWESDFFVRSGTYTNRIRLGEMLELFEEVGFSVEVGAVERWEELPIARSNRDGEFRDVPDSDLRVSAFDVKLLHAAEVGQ